MSGFVKRESTMSNIKPCAGYPYHPPVFWANTGLDGRPTVIVVQPVQLRERHHLPCVRLWSYCPSVRQFTKTLAATTNGESAIWIVSCRDTVSIPCSASRRHPEHLIQEGLQWGDYWHMCDHRVLQNRSASGPPQRPGPVF